MKVTFCGHGDKSYSDEIRERLRNTIEQLINQGADEFLLGGYGSFDMLAAHTVFELKQTYPDIKSMLVVPYLNRDYDMDWYDESVFPPLEKVPKRYAIVRRNYWMVEQADVLVCYVEHDWGGAYKTFAHARAKKKRIIHLSEKSERLK